MNRFFVGCFIFEFLLLGLWFFFLQTQFLNLKAANNNSLLAEGNFVNWWRAKIGNLHTPRYVAWKFQFVYEAEFRSSILFTSYVRKRQFLQSSWITFKQNSIIPTKLSPLETSSRNEEVNISDKSVLHWTI